MKPNSSSPPFPVSTAVIYDKSIKAIRVKVPDSDEEFLLHPATVRRNDRSAQSVVSWSSFFLRSNYRSSQSVSSFPIEMDGIYELGA